MTGRISAGLMVFLLPLTMIFSLVGQETAASTAPPVSSTPAVQAAARSASVPAVCRHPARRGFIPKVAGLRVLGRNVRVLAMGRYSNGVPKPPPLTSTGKQSFGWDKYGPKPGAKRGNVRFNAHTYPDGSALGNALSAKLRVGHLIVIYGRYLNLCYRVYKRVITTPRGERNQYYSTTGKPKLAIIVCSGRRLGPGNWTNRTIWYARPSTS